MLMIGKKIQDYLDLKIKKKDIEHIKDYEYKVLGQKDIKNGRRKAMTEQMMKEILDDWNSWKYDIWKLIKVLGTLETIVKWK